MRTLGTKSTGGELSFVAVRPKNAKKRHALVLEAFGTTDIRRIDGLGGLDPLTSKMPCISGPTVPGTSTTPFG